MNLSIISINYKKSSLTTASMASLWKNYRKEFEDDKYEYLVIDNFSNDDSKLILLKEIKKYKNFMLIQNKENNGYGAANNLGAKYAKGTYLLFLNNDTIVLDNGINKMLTYLTTHQKVGAVGGKMVNFNGVPQTSTGKFYSFFTITLYIFGFQRLRLDKVPVTIQQVDWVKGALLMIKKDIFDMVGKFDEYIFMYTEDMELCYRLHKLGLSCIFFPYISVMHKDQGTTNRSFAIIHIYKYLPYFYKLHKNFLFYNYVKVLLKIKAVILITVGILINNSYLKTTYRKAVKEIE